VTTHGEDEAPDRTLVAAAQAGDGDAFLRLVARYRALTMEGRLGEPALPQVDIALARQQTLADQALEQAYGLPRLATATPSCAWWRATAPGSRPPCGAT